MTLPSLSRTFALSVLVALAAIVAGGRITAVLPLPEADVRSACASLAPRMEGAGRSRVGGPPTAGRLVASPQRAEEVRAMVAFCDTARPHDVAALRETALRSDSALAVANAVRALGRLHAVRGDDVLEALLEDPRPRVRLETILALGECGDPSAAALLERMLPGRDAQTRLVVIHALGLLHGEPSRQALESVLVDPAATREDVAFAQAGLRATESGARHRAVR